MRIDRFFKSLFVVELALATALLVTATPAFAQNFATGASAPATRLQTAAEINQSLQRAREAIAASAAVTPATVAQAADSHIGPDDLVNITVFEAPEMNTTARVSATGEISLQLLGAVHAAGLTPRELESVLQGQLRRTYMKDPHVSVFLQELQSHPVSVVGAVKMPGVFQIRGTKTLIEVLSMAQGLADDAGDAVLVLRGACYAESGGADGSRPDARQKSGAIEEISIKRLLESADSGSNVPVHPGDIVKVPRAGIVYVVGEVNKPGGFVLQNNASISVLQALALAQGTTHTSAISQARIIRTDSATGKQLEIPANLGKIFSGKKPDVLLYPSDIVFVPNSAAKSVFYRGSAAALQTAAGVAIYKW